MINEIVVVIVLYKTKLEDSLTFKSLVKQYYDTNQSINLFVYNNSPDFECDFEKLIEGFHIEYEEDYNNSGLSRAYNKAARYAEKNNKSWLLLLDQDSELPTSFFNRIHESVMGFPEQNLFAPILKHGEIILSPCSFKKMKGNTLKVINSGINSLQDKSIFNSGILVKLPFFKMIGGYNENIPLDFSDHGFIHRVKQNQDTFVVMPILINHEFSTFSRDETIIYRRFRQYVVGVKAYYHHEEKSLWLLFWTVLRAIKLTLIFKSFKFLRALSV